MSDFFIPSLLSLLSAHVSGYRISFPLTTVQKFININIKKKFICSYDHVIWYRVTRQNKPFSFLPRASSSCTVSLDIITPSSSSSPFFTNFIYQPPRLLVPLPRPPSSFTIISRLNRDRRNIAGGKKRDDDERKTRGRMSKIDFEASGSRICCCCCNCEGGTERERFYKVHGPCYGPLYGPHVQHPPLGPPRRGPIRSRPLTHTPALFIISNTRYKRTVGGCRSGRR